MVREDLLALWREIFGSPAPRGMSQTFLRRFLAFELQARRQGGLSRAAMTTLTKDAAGKPAQRKRPALRPGGRLLREWNGVTHVVDVTEEGFVWKGRTHRSLSVIAREITGARWSGPRFFGLDGKTPR
ncbi:bacteriophage-related protein [Marinibacterium profundimaris]|uniref:Bacteriophage-related protein n=2 Tax=Marinibacterium profundimaris TaxID=1679460 RepID=A0A225NAQ9_9RHOB|nr:bacteriophage-related protein [Marinibacterium profundimaris]